MQPTRGLGSAPLPPANRGCALLFGLAPGGVCRVSLRPRGAGIVTVALFLASRRTGVTRHPALGSSDFPHAGRLPGRRATIRPPRWLADCRRLVADDRRAAPTGGDARSGDARSERRSVRSGRGRSRPPRARGWRGRPRPGARRRPGPGDERRRRPGTPRLHLGHDPVERAAAARWRARLAEPPQLGPVGGRAEPGRCDEQRPAGRHRPAPSPRPERHVDERPAPAAISCACRAKIVLRSFVPSISTSTSTGSCERRHGSRYGLPLRPSMNGSSQSVVRPLSPSSMTSARPASCGREHARPPDVAREASERHGSAP